MQSYTDIQSSQSLQSSLSLLLNNDKTALSNSSGSAFPTANLQVGMTCFRTDQNKLYILKDATPTWSMIWDFNAPAVTQGADIGGGVDLNSMTVTGWYHQNTNANASGGTNYPAAKAGLLKVHSDGSMTYQQYQTYDNAATDLFFRSCYNGTWGTWRKVITLDNDGAGSGLDADLLDGKQSSVSATANTVVVRDENGKIAGDILGNAATATNATNAANATNATHLSATTQNNTITGKVASLAMSSSDTTNNGSFICRGSGTGDANLAGMSFHNDNYAIKMGVRADGYFGIGGWSRNAWSWYSDPSGNMVAAGNVTAYSDPRLKENFKRIEDPMKIIYSLDGGTFQWKRGYRHTECKAGKRDYGVLADQVESVMPEIVAESIELDGQQYKTVSYEKIVPVLIEAVKVLSDRINALEVANGD